MQSSDPRFEIRDVDPAIGKGLFALVPVKKGEFILEYTGVKIPTEKADDHPGRYLFEIDEMWTLDGDTDDNLAKYINHSCEPNVEAIIEDGHINIYAERAIKEGKELLIDYGDEYFDEFIRPVGCKCGSTRCRSKVRR
ncbi:MAG: SET domain-containing protein [Candidatus Kaiserbacteria bacterium]|nr:SET domain-containing protein [Candidatus Kaiserbacteria bacterium]